MASDPKTLQEAILYFADPINCREYVVARRWTNGVVCPTCGSDKVRFSEKHNRWQCNSHHAKRQFTVKTGTIFEESPIGLDKWLMAMWLIVNCKNGVSSYEVHRAIGVTQKTAWFLNHRIRMALHAGSFEKLSGHVEADETFIGGKARNMHVAQRRRRITGTGTKDKTAVMGILERGKDGKASKVRTTVIENRKKKTLQAEVHKHVEAGSALYTDFLLSYEGLEGKYAHQVVDHAVQYVDGNVHTNSLENFWSLLKRSISGTYVSVEPFHLFRYLDEQAYRFNNREDMNDGDRFSLAVSQVVGKRLTYDELTGKDGQERLN
ncbi:MAG TPA: IS1595 family transposase [Bryobacteraceae bacterium]|jgi:transposase-like protein|nr:IS1595 family transposase [Bryobacteraceae bacterium]